MIFKTNWANAHGGFKKMRLNKFIALSVFALIAMCLAPLMVSASLSVTDTFDETNPTFGGPNQEASNPEAEDEDDEVINVTSTISVNNSFTEDLNITGITFSDGQFGLTQNDFVLQSVGTVILVNTADTIDILANIPETLDAVDSNFEEVALYVGKITINTHNSAADATFNVYMQRENKLIFDDLDALINNKETESNIDDGDDIEELGPGDHIEFSIVVESDYHSNSNLDIEDVEIDISCNDDDDLDFEDDNIDVGDLGPKDDSDETLIADIEEDAEEETPTCTLTVSGTDENGATHGQSIEFTMEIDRKSNDIVIRNVALSPSALVCEDSAFQVSVEMVNLGTKDEDEAAVQVQSVALGIDDKITNLVIDEDESLTETFVFSVSPEDLTEGKFALLVTTFYDNTKVSNSEVVQLENMCIASVDDDDSDDSSDVEFTDAISMDSETVTASTSKLVSIKVQLTNEGNIPVDYVVSLEDLEDFGTSTSSKNVHLNPGQTSTVFLNMRTNEDIEVGAKYTASVVLKDSNTGETLETETFTVEIDGESKESSIPGIDLGDSSLPLVILNIALVVIAIFLIKLIFSGNSRKKRAAKKLADFDNKTVRKKK
ncbi:TPA: hypothetical protein HA278_06270 [Candidatus Woesearchaeota archaeon]|nr:hypothetical protein [Candidatus Woesearchaeota archaeon]|tara:strand:+ start:5874 stop:7688 length:1815 start_codon:yes stop_codon:yes gene_type:complete